jgi:uncharacterized membrane protein YeaQ/YmgE (transglycosylase-associated protein family)
VAKSGRHGSTTRRPNRNDDRRSDRFLGDRRRRWLARWADHEGGRLWLVGDIVVGVIGALIGGWLFGVLGIAVGGLIGSIIAAVVGAIILLVLLRLIRRA